jgi:hypothetical protein
MTFKQAIERMGPFVHGQKSAFVAKYGTERDLLAEVDVLLEGVEI